MKTYILHAEIISNDDDDAELIQADIRSMLEDEGFTVETIGIIAKITNK
jgi:hypothetical protein